MAKAPTSEYDRNPSAVSLGLALNMAWQLGIVVLVPILFGHVLDNRLHSGQTVTIIGLVIATAGMIVVVRQTLKQFQAAMKPQAPKEHHD